MGTRKRHKPARLAEKLSTIRSELGLSQSELISKLNCKEVPLLKSDISNYEAGRREPPLIVLLRYAQIANVTIDFLADDSLKDF